MISTIQEVDIQEAFVWGTENTNCQHLNPSQRTGYDNWQDAILPEGDYSSLRNQDFIDWENERLQKVNKEQEAMVIRSGAKSQIESIPNYATWTESQATSWIEANVTDLASAKGVLKALTRLFIALRNHEFPELQD